MPFIIDTPVDDRTVWLNKLVEKKLTRDESISDANAFAIKNLPRHCRILRPDDGVHFDYWSDRLNVYLSEDEIVYGVKFF